MKAVQISRLVVIPSQGISDTYSVFHSAKSYRTVNKLICTNTIDSGRYIELYTDI